MLKIVKTLLLSLLFTSIIITGCNSNFENEISAEDFRSLDLVNAKRRIRSDLNPGYGNAVYFTGTFKEGKNWTLAVRGSYDNGWYLDVHAVKDFEWKALTGSYELGEKVELPASLEWESGFNHFETVAHKKVYVLSRTGNATYGATCYFTGTFDGADNWNTAVEADFYTYNGYKYYLFVTSESENFEWKTLSRFGSLGDYVSIPFTGLTWDPGENRTQDDAISFEDYWAENTRLQYFGLEYDSVTEKLYFKSSDSLYGYNSIFQDEDETVLEIVNNDNDKIIYSGRYNDIRQEGIAFDKNDSGNYTASLIPVSYYGDWGTPYDVEFSPASM